MSTGYGFIHSILIFSLNGLCLTSFTYFFSLLFFFIPFSFGLATTVHPFVPRAAAQHISVTLARLQVPWLTTRNRFDHMYASLASWIAKAASQPHFRIWNCKTARLKLIGSALAHRPFVLLLLLEHLSVAAQTDCIVYRRAT